MSFEDRVAKRLMMLRHKRGLSVDAKLWDEESHPRDDHGMFSTGGGGGVAVVGTVAEPMSDKQVKEHMTAYHGGYKMGTQPLLTQHFVAHAVSGGVVVPHDHPPMALYGKPADDESESGTHKFPKRAQFWSGKASDEEERDDHGRWTAGASASSVSSTLAKAGFDRHVPPKTVMYVSGPAGKAGATGFRVRQSTMSAHQGHVEVQAMHANGYPLGKGENVPTKGDLVSKYEDALHSAGFTTEPMTYGNQNTGVYVTGRNKSAEISDTKAGGGNPQPLIDWFNNGADGQIDWGSGGDFDQCVAVASKHMSEEDAKGFCNLRHQDATGMSTSEHAAEDKDKSTALVEHHLRFLRHLKEWAADGE